MTPDHDPTRAPAPEQLVAYHDGELSETERAAVEAWLAEHPHAAADLAAWGRLDRLCRDTTALEPSPAAWAGVFQRVADGRRLAPAPRRLLLRLLLGLGAAAAVLAVFLLTRGGPPGQEPDVEPFPVVSDNDVVIIQINGDDTSLVAAPMPIGDVEPLATVGEVVVLEPPTDRLEWMKLQGGVPMLVDPKAVAAP
jgi:anti-sigma factor RsiW